MSAYVEGSKYFGLWRRSDGRPGSLVAAYIDSADAPQTVILGRSAMNFGTVAASLRLHGQGPFGFTLTSEAEVGQPLYLIHYIWAPPQR